MPCPYPKQIVNLMLVSALLLQPLSAQAASARINGRLITPNMEQSDVRTLAGQPHQTQQRQGPGGKRYPTWMYRCRYQDSNCRPSSNGRGRTIWILFSDGRVIDIHSKQR